MGKIQYIKYLLFLYPAAFTLIFNKFNSVSWYLSDFSENVIFSIVLVSIGLFIKKSKVRKSYFIFVYLFLSLIAFAETSYYFLYKNVISSSAIFIILETNSNEALEYISSYLHELIYILIFIIVPIFFAIYFIKNLKSKVYRFFRLKTAMTIIFTLIVLFSLMKFTHLFRYNLPYTAIKSYVNYFIEMNKYKKLVFDKKGGEFSNVIHNEIEDEIYVIIIGESSNRDHLGLYNYYRNTTPNLEKLENDLLIYQDVISPHANTISSLSKALTLGNYENPDKKFDGFVFQLFNKAGFETYWLSNQKPIGIHETGITKLSKSADKRFFVNSKSNRKESTYDEMIFTPLELILSEKKNKKFIIIQLLGSHVDYSNRYPKKFEKYKDVPKSKFKNKKAFDLINSYDNSILYTDYIVHKVIDEVVNTNTKSYVLYFSDHGEDVFQSTNKAFHAEHYRSKYMYEIPFVLWRSEKYLKDTNNLVFDIDRKYMTDDLIYSIADLSNIRFDEQNVERSVFNIDFIERERIIIDSLNYDLTFDIRKHLLVKN